MSTTSPEEEELISWASLGFEIYLWGTLAPKSQNPWN
jgi:hypothetical protein